MAKPQPPKCPLFGRGRDLAHLHGRIAQPSLTAIVGRPQAGKAWLLERFRDDLANPDLTLVVP